MMHTSEYKPGSTRDLRSNQPFQKGPFFQAKFSVNAPGDRFEQEADSMADHVIRMTDNSLLQRKCSECEKEEKQVSRKESSDQETDASPAVENYIGSLSNKGQVLDGSARSFFEPRFANDFSNVKIHNDAAAAKSAQSINALAYTTGNHIVFNEGQYSPGTESGKRLLAHELTHVIQQGRDIQPKSIQAERLPCTSKREVDVYLVSLPGSTRNAQDDVNYANTVLCQCGIHMNVTGAQSWQTRVLDTMDPPGILNETSYQTPEIVNMLNYQPGGASAIHVFFVPANTLNDRGGSYGYPGVLTGVPYSVSVTNIGVQDTLAHEITHVLLRDGAHHSDPNNLMAAGSTRRVGVDELTQTQCNALH